MITNTDDTTPSRNNPFAATLVDNKRVTAERHFQDVRLITFDISNSTIRYWLILAKVIIVYIRIALLEI